jgi:hypothetical protein
LLADRPLALFPFWGNWCLVDFALASMPTGARVTVVLEEEARAIAGPLAGRWKGHPVDIVDIDAGVGALAKLFAAEGAEWIVLAALSAVWLLAPGALERLVASAGAARRVIKASVQRTPVELYAVRRDRLIGLLDAAGRLSRTRRARETLFEATLDPAIETIEELPGELLFFNDLSDLHQRTLRLPADGVEIVRQAARFPELSVPPREAVIAQHARVTQSWIAPGATVEGRVDGSVIFPGAVVHRGAEVVHSVVMNGVVVGAGASVANALLLPWGDVAGSSLRAAATVGERAVVGQRQSTARNVRYPEQIRDGLAVVGMDVTLPPGFRMEGGSLACAGADAAELRRIKVLKRGQSVGGLDRP